MPWRIRLDNSAGDTSMKRKKEKQLPLSSPENGKKKKLKYLKHDTKEIKKGENVKHGLMEVRD